MTNAQDRFQVMGAVDGLHSEKKAFGWVLVNHSMDFENEVPVEFFVTVLGKPVKSTELTRHRRGDLSNVPDNKAGFSIELEGDISSLQWLNDEIEILVSAAGQEPVPIKKSKVFHESAFQQLFIARIGRADETVSTRFFSAVSKSRALKEPTSSILKSIAAQTTKPASNETPVGSPVFLPSGTNALDGFAILGLKGHIFLTGGTNNVRELYSEKSDAGDRHELAEKWLVAFEEREKFLSAQNVRYIQLIMPEKISAFPDLFPEKVHTPSEPLRLVENGIRRNPLLKTIYLSVLDIFRAQAQPSDLYHRADTHFSERGCFVLLEHILSTLGFEQPSQPVFQHNGRFWSGDLSERFFGQPLLNLGIEVSGNEIDKLGANVSLFKSTDPLKGAHIGKQRFWKNKAAPIKKKIAVFGNSFFECGESARHLSWWFCRYFEEFHFYWTPVLDQNAVDENKYDIVICQTIERFLTRPPER